MFSEDKNDWQSNLFKIQPELACNTNLVNSTLEAPESFLFSTVIQISFGWSVQSVEACCLLSSIVYGLNTR